MLSQLHGLVETGQRSEERLDDCGVWWGHTTGTAVVAFGGRRSQCTTTAFVIDSTQVQEHVPFFASKRDPSRKKNN